MTRAIQDEYPERFAHCYGCGPANPDGKRLKSFLEGDEAIARHTPGPSYSGGVPGHVYGGLIASLLDCHGAASASGTRSWRCPRPSPSTTSSSGLPYPTSYTHWPLPTPVWMGTVARHPHRAA